MEIFTCLEKKKKMNLIKIYIDFETFIKDRRRNAIGDERFNGSAFMNIARKLLRRLKK